MPRTMLGIGEKWLEIVPPREWLRIKAMAEEYDALAMEIDRRYEAGKVVGVEDLEERAERLLEDLSGLYDYYTEGDPDTGEGYSIEERIISVWNRMDSFCSREDWISNMRSSIEIAVYQGSGVWVSPTDEQVLAIAEDIVRRREALLRRYKQPKKPYLGAVAVRYKIWVETPDEAMQESIHVIQSEADAYIKRALVEIIVRAELQLDAFKDSLLSHFSEFYWGAQEAIRETTKLLAEGKIEQALGVWQQFEELDEAIEGDSREFGPPPLWPLVGRIRVEMD